MQIYDLIFLLCQFAYIHRPCIWSNWCSTRLWNVFVPFRQLFYLFISFFFLGWAIFYNLRSFSPFGFSSRYMHILIHNERMKMKMHEGVEIRFRTRNMEWVNANVSCAIMKPRPGASIIPSLQHFPRQNNWISLYIYICGPISRGRKSRLAGSSIQPSMPSRYLVGS